MTPFSLIMKKWLKKCPLLKSRHVKSRPRLILYAPARFSLYSTLRSYSCLVQTIPRWILLSTPRSIPYSTPRSTLFSTPGVSCGRLSSFKEKLLRGKAITSLQFLSEPTNIVKSQEASLDWTLCSGKYFNPFSQWIFFGKTQVWIIQLENLSLFCDFDSMSFYITVIPGLPL